MDAELVDKRDVTLPELEGLVEGHDHVGGVEGLQALVEILEDLQRGKLRAQPPSPVPAGAGGNTRGPAEGEAQGSAP